MDPSAGGNQATAPGSDRTAAETGLSASGQLHRPPLSNRGMGPSNYPNRVGTNCGSTRYLRILYPADANRRMGTSGILPTLDNPCAPRHRAANPASVLRSINNPSMGTTNRKQGTDPGNPMKPQSHPGAIRG